MVFQDGFSLNEAVQRKDLNKRLLFIYLIHLLFLSVGLLGIEAGTSHLWSWTEHLTLLLPCSLEPTVQCICGSRRKRNTII